MLFLCRQKNWGASSYPLGYREVQNFLRVPTRWTGSTSCNNASTQENCLIEEGPLALSGTGGSKGVARVGVGESEWETLIRARGDDGL